VKRFILALAALATSSAAAVTTANAVEFGVGPNGVYVGPDRDHYYHERYYDNSGNCRVVISHRTNRYGEDVEVRRRICD
jgi:hypothetical protein